MIGINRFANVFKSKKQKKQNKDKLLYKAIYNKVNRKKHKYEEPQDWDGTLIKCTRLLQNCADPNKLKLSAEDLQTLSSEQQKYYFECFLPKLSEQIKQSKKISGKIKDQVERVILQITRSQSSSVHRKSCDSDESGYESDGNSATAGEKRSTDDITSLITQPNSRKTPSKKRFKGVSVKKIREEFKQFKKNAKRLVEKKNTIKPLISKKKGENTIPLSFANLGYDPASTNAAAETQISNEIKNDSNCLLEAIKNGEQKKFIDHLESGADITIQDEEGNNILHRIALLEGNKKCKLLDELTKCEKTPQENLVQLINSQSKDGKTPLQIALIAKIRKEKHDLITIKDNTLQFIIKLLELGAEPNQLEFSKGSLKELSEEQKRYYRNFLEKLAELVKKPQLEQGIKDRIVIKTAQIIDDNGYPLHSAIRDGDKNKFNELLQSGYNITALDAEGNTVLHYAVILKKEAKYEFTKLILEKNKEWVNTKNNNGLTPIYILLEQIQKKNKDRSCTDRKFEKTSRYQTLKLLLESGADITTKDKNDNNALHRIALLKGKQKVTCLSLILDLVEKGVISKDKLSEAINATNKKGDTPLRIALTTKARKEKIEYLRQGTIFDLEMTHDNTTKFCAMLLQIGANLDSLELKDPKFHTKKYYLVLRDLKDYRETPQKAREKARELKEELEKYGCRTPLKSVKSGVRSAVKKAGSGLKAAWNHIDPARRTCIVIVMAVTITIITMTAVAFFEGKVAIGAAIPIIVIAGICLISTLGFNMIKKFCKSLTTDKCSTSDEKNHFHSTTEQNQVLEATPDNNQQNLENEPESPVVQELQDQSVQESPDQLERAGTPNTNMSEISMVNKFINRLKTLVNIHG